MSQTPETKLASSIEVVVNGAKRELFMSFALLNQLAYLVGDAQRVGMMLLDPTVREVCLQELLAERTKTGRVVEPVKMDDVDISLEDIERVLDWSAEHVLVFTLRVAEKSTAHQLRHQDRLLNLTSTVNGLADSLLKKSAA